ncbi:MAG: FecR domain-containing protein [Bacteroidota bacterium]
MNDRILHISSEELALEDQFIAWVKNPEGALAADWSTWLVQHPEQAEKVDAARHLVQAISTQSYPSLRPERKKALWEAIEAEANGAKMRTLPTARNNRWVWSVAAGVALLVTAGLWWMLRDTTTTLQTARADIQTYELPDGSVASLNADSKLTYDAAGWEKQRELTLSGEAFFSVEKGQLFSVKTTLGTVQVLGTSFNVEERNDQLTVYCYTGKVRVTAPNGKSVTLTPQQGVRVSQGQLTSLTATDNKASQWRESIHHFAEVPLTEVMAELERQFDVTVVMDAEIANYNYVGFFSTKDSLEEALEIICWTYNLTFKVSGKTVEISAE